MNFFEVEEDFTDLIGEFNQGFGNPNDDFDYEQLGMALRGHIRYGIGQIVDHLDHVRWMNARIRQLEEEVQHLRLGQGREGPSSSSAREDREGAPMPDRRNFHWNWNAIKCGINLELSADSISVKNKGGHNYKGNSVRLVEPFDGIYRANLNGNGTSIFYAEMEIIKINKIGQIHIGLLDGDQFLRCSNAFVGLKSGLSIENDGNFWVEGVCQQLCAQSFGRGDVIGCGLKVNNAENGQGPQAFFTKNGSLLQMLDANFAGQRGNGKQLFLTVTLNGAETALKANFGQSPFRYDISEMQ